MTRFLKLAFFKACRIPSDKWRILFLLAGGVVLKSLTVLFWDIGTTTLLIDNHRLFSLGMDLIGAGIFMSLAGLYLWRTDRQNGRGAVGFGLWCIAGMTIGLSALAFFGEDWIIDLLFLMKYALYLILTTVYWAVARRFVRFQFSSLKFLSLFCLELAAPGLGGLLILILSLSAGSLLILSLFFGIGLVLVLRTVFDLAPLPPETFIRQTDGIRDVFEKPLVWDIFILFFLGTAARVLTEAVLYLKLADTGIQPLTVLSLVWILFGALGLMLVLALYHTRYIYTTLSGVLIFGLSVVATGVAALGRHSGPVASGYLMVLLLSHFYLTNYLGLLPRVLSRGIGPRLKKRVMTAIAPLGFIFCGCLCLNFEYRVWACVLIGIGCALLLFTVHSAVLYAQVLDRMIVMRKFSSGPLLLPFPRLTSKLTALLASSRADDVIYALKMMQVAHHPAADRALVKSLHHPIKAVRQFALYRVRKSYYFADYRPHYQQLFHKDPENLIRNLALTNLILSDPNPRRYEQYLTDRLFRSGAVGGFLGQGILSLTGAVETLTRLAQSKMVRDNLSALSLISDYPDPLFGPLTESLLKHPNRTIVRQAILTAGHLKDPALLPRLFRSLDDPRLEEYALQALAAYGKAAFPPIEKMIMRPDTPVLRRKQLILFLGSLSSGEGKQILLRALMTENQKLRKAIVQNILDSAIVWVGADRKTILKQCLGRDLDRIATLLHLREVFSNAPTHESEESIGFFLRAVQEDIDDTRELILYQLLLLENTAMFSRAVRILQTDSYELFLPAMGVVQDLLPNRLYQRLKPVLLLPLSQRRKATLSGLSSDEAVQTLSDLIIRPPFALNHWIRATALYALRRLGSAAGIPAAEATLTDPNPVVLEAAIWTLMRLQSDKKALHRQLLTIPTSRLSELSLDHLLDS